MPALAELEAAWLEARADAGYRDQLARLQRDFCGRPTPLYHAERLSEAAGRPVWLKREDLMHTGSHKLNNALGQCLLAKRMGKPRIIAETGAGQHGVATATACALLDLECVVYMGTEDIRRQMPNVQRMRLLGATVAGVDAGSCTLKEAVSAAIRDWVANVATTHYAIGSCVGPAPFPSLVRDLQRIIGDEARAEMLERLGRLPSRVIACVGGGSNSIGIFIPFVDDAEVELIGCEAAGDGLATGRHGAPLTVGGRGGVLHGAYSAIMQDEDGQITEAHSISAGLDYPGVGPEHAHLRDTGRARYEAVTDEQALDAFQRLAELEGIIPALESGARRRVGARQRAAGRGPAGADLPVGPRGQGPRRGAGAAGMSVAAGQDTISAAFATSGKRAALMPYLMGGFPDLAGSRAIGEAYAEGGADLVELGVPFSDPLADGPVIHAAGTAALEAGATVHGVLEVGRGARGDDPGGAHVLRQPRAGARSRAVRRRAGGAGDQRPDRPRPADGGGGRGPRRLRRRRRGARRPRGPDDARGAARGDRAQRPRLRLHRRGHRHDRGAAGAGRRPAGDPRPDEGARRRPGGARLRHRHARVGGARGRRRRGRRDRRIAPGARRGGGTGTGAGGARR